ncbi:hypothetical protein L198_02925 [Cryptococcus wingfieldii CBS 7118]|uniref:N-acetyltransferase domain-containing protein n=1 Tax=Cryptococcus wingfieldii CBS 7118 TaxID=1295528 RepID=A0A1E3JIE4_9TREE|nr:hypothetical protein L198_02925 [Cryptococcus wingfieldii CBS 7118]ODO00605.1 hypothetical protein L198_02925 [Cryptococcus wingfieldii CBS 7118]
MVETSATPSCPIVVDQDGEAYLPIAGHPNLRLTLRKESDTEAIMEIANTPEISQWYRFRAVPFLLSDAQKENAEIPLASAYLQKITSSLPNRPEGAPDGALPIRMPFNILRDVSTGKAMGSFRFGGPGMDFGPGRENAWEASYEIGPTLWGKGVGTRVVGAALDYARWIGVKLVIGVVQKVNLGSSGVLRKNGFTQFLEFQDEWPAERGGGIKTVCAYEVAL